jgi:hypothetical protein
MNKKSIAHLRNQFKEDNELMKISDIFHVYVKKETGEIYHEGSQSFEMVETEQREMFLNNFKSVLKGKLDSKVFALKFKHGIEDSTQTILYDGLNDDSIESWKESMLSIVEKMFGDGSYDMDTVVTFIRGEYSKPTTKRSKESEEGGTDEIYTSKFILCSVNKTDKPKKSLLFDYIEKEFKSNSVLDPIINLSSPLVGFVFPAFNDNSADVNHIIYSAGVANSPDTHFIEKVLNCEDITTSKEDKQNFEKILRQVIGNKVEATKISYLYEKIHLQMADDEGNATMLDVSDIESLLHASGIEDVKDVALAFKEVLDDDSRELKASNVIPNYTSKSIKINTKTADVSISPKELRNLRQITHKGKKCLLIEIEDDAIIEGFELKAEKL